MILQCNYEELRALNEGARIVLQASEANDAAVAAPPVGHARVRALLTFLEGDLTIRTLAAQRQVLEGVETVVEVLREEMESTVVDYHPAQEAAVAAYFDFGHALSVLERVREMGQEMEAMIEVMTGGVATEDTARSFVFPD